MSVQSLARLIYDLVTNAKKNKAVYPAVYYTDHVYMNGRNYKCDVVTGIEIENGEQVFVMMDDTGTVAAVVGK